MLLSEVMRRELGSPYQRRPIDLATVASWPSGVAGKLGQLLQKALRVTDIISKGKGTSEFY